VYCSDDDLTTNSSKIKILEKFVRNYEISLLSLFNKKDSLLVCFDEFVLLMANLGFVKSKNESVELNGKALLKDAWKILSNANEEAKVDTNQILIFCSVVLGIYKGEEGSNNVNNELKQELIAHPVENKEEKVNTQIEKAQGQASPKDTNIISTKVSPSKKKRKMPHRFSSVSEHKTYFNETGFKLNVKTIKPEEEKNKNLLTVVIPELDITKYYYNKKTVKQIKILFRNMYDTRMHFLTEEKRKTRQENQETQQKETTKTPFMPSHKLRQSADNYRQKIFEQIERDSEHRKKDPKLHEKSFSINPHKLKLEEAYAIIRKKKENEIAKIKIQQEEDEMKHCTFHPNIDKKKNTEINIKETVQKLYIDGVTKQKTKLNEEKKEEILSEECCFNPKVNKFNAHVFEVNPLLHDELVKKEVDRFERARVEKKIQELQKKKGINNIKQYNIDELIKEEELPCWNFAMERKNHRETIETTNRNEKKAQSNSTRQEFKKTVRETKMEMKREVLLNIEVNIDDSERVEKLEIFPNDNPLVVVEEFCKKFDLSEEKKILLQKVIEEKLGNNAGLNSNRSEI